MKNKGYIGIIVLLIAVVIVAVLMVNQYASLGIGGDKTRSSLEAGNASELQSPIDRARGIKETLETRDSGLLDNQ